MSDMKLAVMGAAGRMGIELIRAIHESGGCVVAGGTEAPGSDAVGRDLGELAGVGTLGVAVTDQPLELFTHIDGILDFTGPAASISFVELSAQARIVHIMGTTGFSSDEDNKIEAAARHATIVKAGNMSLGVNILTELTKQISAALDEDFDIEVLEMHHRHKVDAPSGTALMLGEAAAEGRKINLEKRSVRTRDGHTGERGRGDIGFATLRGGSVVGEHTVIFAADGERVEITHKAADRGIFARGAIKSALWAMDKSPGLYSMKDVLGL